MNLGVSKEKRVLESHWDSEVQLKIISTSSEGMTYCRVKKPWPTRASNWKSEINLEIHVRLNLQVGVKWLDYRAGESTSGKNQAHLFLSLPSRGFTKMLPVLTPCQLPLPLWISVYWAPWCIFNWIWKHILQVLSFEAIFRGRTTSQLQLGLQNCLRFCGFLRFWWPFHWYETQVYNVILAFFFFFFLGGR